MQTCIGRLWSPILLTRIIDILMELEAKIEFEFTPGRPEIISEYAWNKF